MNAYAVVDGITFPLLFKVYKPQTRLKEGEKYKTKPELAVEIIGELKQLGFKFEVVLADSLYGESSDFIAGLSEFKLKACLSHQKRSRDVDACRAKDLVHGVEGGVTASLSMAKSRPATSQKWFMA